jgi:hypothetical protein
MISVIKAIYQNDFRIELTFSDGVCAIVDLRQDVYKYAAAEPLRDARVFPNFYLDGWPTLAWPCGFDLSPEYLYELATGNKPAWAC